MAKTILGIGADYDDCIFGISGTLLARYERIIASSSFR